MKISSTLNSSWISICERRKSSSREITEAREVVLSSPLKLLPSGGMITRAAWGKMTTRSMVRYGMPTAHGEDARADDLRQVRALVETEPDEGGLDHGEPDAELGQSRVDDDELDEERRAAHEPDVESRDVAQHAMAREAQEGGGQPQSEANGHHGHGQPHRGPRALEQIWVEQVLLKGRPIPPPHRALAPLGQVRTLQLEHLARDLGHAIAIEQRVVRAVGLHVVHHLEHGLGEVLVLGGYGGRRACDAG